MTNSTTGTARNEDAGRTIGNMSVNGSHPLKITRTQLSDGRELLFFDDSPKALSGEVTRNTEDHRGLPETHTDSEMRRDPLTGRWVVFAAHRMNRTFLPPANENPLAPTKEGALPTEVPAEDYDVVVFENRFPSFSLHMDVPEDYADYADEGELVPRRPARARCEVVCFAPNPSVSFKDLSEHRIRTIIEVWAHRTAALSTIDGVQTVFPFENRGEEIGVTLQHPHGQIYSYPFLPPRISDIMCQIERTPTLFEDMLNSELADGRRIVTETESFVAFVPAAAKWPLEVMVMPRRQVADFTELNDTEKDELTGLLKSLYTAVDNFFDGVEKTPYIAAWNQAPVQHPDRDKFRMHLQLFSLMRSPHRMKFLASSESAIGVWINDTTPEIIAETLRKVW